MVCMKCKCHDLVILSTQYTLSQETIETLKKPTFDVWHWEHNEVWLHMNECVLYIKSAFGICLFMFNYQFPQESNYVPRFKPDIRC